MDHLLVEIQNKREKMIESAILNGFTNDDTIRCSQELDKLIIEYQRSVQKDLYNPYVLKRQFSIMWTLDFPKVCT